MIFKEMDPKEVLRLLAEDEEKRGGDPGILAIEAKRHEEYFANLCCQYCGGSCHPFVSPEKLFTGEGILPNYQAECNDCGAQFTPYTNIEIKGPTKSPLEPD